jgi:hypothetical protein
MGRFPAGDMLHFSHVDPKKARQIREQRANTLLVRRVDRFQTFFL